MDQHLFSISIPLFTSSFVTSTALLGNGSDVDNKIKSLEASITSLTKQVDSLKIRVEELETSTLSKIDKATHNEITNLDVNTPVSSDICTFIFSRGDKKGNSCGKPCENDVVGRCSLHKYISKVPSTNKCSFFFRGMNEAYQCMNNCKKGYDKCGFHQGFPIEVKYTDEKINKNPGLTPYHPFEIQQFSDRFGLFFWKSINIVLNRISNDCDYEIIGRLDDNDMITYIEDEKSVLDDIQGIELTINKRWFDRNYNELKKYHYVD